MRIEQQPAFVLHGRAYRETSLLLECFTRDHGRIGLIARGVRKEKSRLPRALLQPLTPVSLAWSGTG
jgi:DNA repair protein RecO (recombination protein O)